MINTLYSLDLLGSSRALFVALFIGFGFGFALERAGFSSSRRLAGVFYFKDMAVVKVMFTALITAALGLAYLVALGWIQLDQVFLMPTIYGAQIVGGLLFGIGFAMGSWCPGTAAAGMAAGRIDALVFLGGAVGGSILFNETFPIFKTLYGAGNQGTLMVYSSMGMSRNSFLLIFTLVAVACFWLCEWVEKTRTGRSVYLGSSFLKAFSLALIAAAAGLFVLSPVTVATVTDEKALMAGVEEALDHIEPEALADRLMSGEAGIVVVDIRPQAEYELFHIRGAINVPLTDLIDTLQPYKGEGVIVLYSNGMTHPAQARDSLQRQGFGNVYLLTDGLQGFRERCLKPVSLRSEPLMPNVAARVNAWRTYFSSQAKAGGIIAAPATEQVTAPTLVETDWLAARLTAPGFKIIDLRPQPEYNTGHIPGSLSLNVESLRGNVGGVPSMLLPSSMIAAQFSLLGLSGSDTIVLVSGEKFHDATLAGMACERVGHLKYAVLDGGFAKWTGAGLPVDAVLPSVKQSVYPEDKNADGFTVDYKSVLGVVGNTRTVIIDVRPADAYSGVKSEEARAGHIPGAVNRPYTDDVLVSSNKVTVFKPLKDLADAYRQIVPSKDTDIIVHCRTGHQGSQTYFVLRRLLGYTNVRWYDAGWTEWAARSELPVSQ